jgi:putative transposase
MPRELERRYGFGHHHFVTFSCYRRLPHLATSEARDIFESSLERTRQNYGFTVDSYVVMPEHVHLLVSEPRVKDLSVALQALKISVSKRLSARPFWQRRFYDFNVYTNHKRIEKRRYIHHNPFTRGLVAHPRHWTWSSYRHWAYGESSVVQLESTWAFALRMQKALQERAANPHLKIEMWGTQPPPLEEQGP